MTPNMFMVLEALMSVKPTSAEIRLREQVRELRLERDGLTIAINRIEAVLEELSAPSATHNLPRESMRQQILQNMDFLLRENGPMHREALKAALENRGIYVHSIQTLANYLSKDARFAAQKTGNGVWGLREVGEQSSDGDVDPDDIPF